MKATTSDPEDRRGRCSCHPAPRTIAGEIRRILRTPGPDGVTPARKIAEALVERALTGDVEAIRLILDRVED